MARSFTRDSLGRYHDRATGRLVSQATVDRSRTAVRAFRERTRAEAARVERASEAARKGWETRRAREAPPPPVHPVRPSVAPPGPPPPPLPGEPIQRLTQKQRQDVLRSRVHVAPGKVARYRGSDGRWVARADAERLTARQRRAAGIRRELFSRTKAGLLGPRAKGLVQRLIEFEEDEMDWREVPDNYLEAAQRLSLV